MLQEVTRSLKLLFAAFARIGFQQCFQKVICENHFAAFADHACDLHEVQFAQQIHQEATLAGVLELNDDLFRGSSKISMAMPDHDASAGLSHLFYKPVEAETFGVCAVQLLLTTRGWDGKGVYNLYPPFCEFRIALAQLVDVRRYVLRVRQRQHHVRDHEPPLAIVQGTPHFLALEDGNAGAFILLATHGDVEFAKEVLDKITPA